MGKHTKVKSLWRRYGPPATIVVFLATFLVTYPQPAKDGIVIPPAHGVYDNYQQQPAPVAVRTDR